jgi:SAM-dependent methyltransferase
MEQSGDEDAAEMNVRSPGASDTQATYARRFASTEAYRRQLWEVLCRDFFQRYVPPDAAVLDVAAGYCEFINAIRASSKVALDLNPDEVLRAGPDVRTVVGSALGMDGVPDASQDVVFISNFFEHLTRPEIVKVMAQCSRVLRSGGRLLVLQPNIRYAWRDYWMFFDHVTPIDDRALCEVLELSGFCVRTCIPRFLPYTTQSRLPKALVCLKIYLRLPVLWRVFGKQAFILAERSEVGGNRSC